MGVRWASRCVRLEGVLVAPMTRSTIWKVERAVCRATAAATTARRMQQVSAVRLLPATPADDVLLVLRCSIRGAQRLQLRIVSRVQWRRSVLRALPWEANCRYCARYARTVSLSSSFVMENERTAPVCTRG